MAESSLPAAPPTIEGFRVGARIRESGVLAVHDGISKLDLPVECYLVRCAALTGGFEVDDFVANVRRAAGVHHEALLPFITGGRYVPFDTGAAVDQQDGDCAFAIAKSVDGRSLDQVLPRDGPFDEPRAVALATSVAGALDALERAGMRHGDLAPQRICLVGINAFVVRPPRILPAALSPRLERYQAPEEARGAESGVVSDLFVLGLILFEALSGSHPLASAPDPRRALRDWKVPDLAGPLRRTSPEFRAVIAK